MAGHEKNFDQVAKGAPEVKRIFGLFKSPDGHRKSRCEEPSSRVPSDWPPHLKNLHREATLALKRLRLTNLDELSDRERAEHGDRLTMMQAMADPTKTAAVYFATAEARSIHEGRPLSEKELAEAEEICRGLGQEALSEEERQAVERFARA